MAYEWKALLKAVAPELWQGLNSSISGQALAALAEPLGLPQPTIADQAEAAIDQALRFATPEVLRKVKAAGAQFKFDMAELGIDTDKIVDPKAPATTAWP